MLKPTQNNIRPNDAIDRMNNDNISQVVLFPSDGVFTPKEYIFWSIRAESSGRQPNTFAPLWPLKQTDESSDYSLWPNFGQISGSIDRLARAWKAEMCIGSFSSGYGWIKVQLERKTPEPSKY